MTGESFKKTLDKIAEDILHLDSQITDIPEYTHYGGLRVIENNIKIMYEDSRREYLKEMNAKYRKQGILFILFAIGYILLIMGYLR
jgi:hypothetical protein